MGDKHERSKENIELALIWLGFVVATTIVANSKGRSGFGWFWLSIPFGFFALLIVALMPAVKQGPSPDTHVKCPDCRELVSMDSRRCEHCGCAMVPQS